MSDHEQQVLFPELIKKKRDGDRLTEGEIRDFVNAVRHQTIQESQIGAMLMAVWYRGMDAGETHILTQEMIHSGEVLCWPQEWAGLVVDKHSTGGVGDKVSLPLAPALAACGCKVPMISGRGLAHTGGTLDKLESIPGFSIHQSAEQLRHIMEAVGCCIVGQTESLVPTDKVLYALRDATSTVDSLPLITSSIMSKKGAESLSALVLDVKYGKAALSQDIKSARALAQSLVTTGSRLGMCVGAVLSRMDSPIGHCVGNTLEAIEAIECLKGRGPSDLLELVICLGGCLLKMISKVDTLASGKEEIRRVLENGEALSKFRAMLQAQGTAAEVVESLCATDSDYFSVLKRAKFRKELEVQEGGTVLEVDAMALAQVLYKLGTGRAQAGDPINHSVGAELLVRLGQRVVRGDPWVRIHYETPALTSELETILQGAIVIGKEGDLNTTALVTEFIPSDLEN
ncbi:thymidine phosphorylase isoform X2 [Brienomyrus brachyistius]|nr:thymidine phosphorylase isoform X2 [Brienomyrus brachyistius]XP_048864803.1 thymidine phosphorylase isoform X2 [Brienomyrus brachyistius]XP_048864804.1 thymidine phosphorylase isoform X2 [Brienomyrus brachyistius]XP_048864805.1 thymidine phosphorylase isoform X2 [Brienomyrus brachyistius]XP_048864806.1 thymidine phosphorylase isoform X2 [Brienomyrus brachyistius]XP_048864807.1 thymidine phosphorylase isoform X2 [Brienomyrus brachyistius]XP_048864809.1 thymidine phosphorylase isoform X2 [Br